MIRFRPHRGGYAESLAEVKTFKDGRALADYLHTEYPEYCSFVTEFYGYDGREGWNDDTYLVMADGQYAIGMADKGAQL